MIAQHLEKVPKMQRNLRSSWCKREYSFRGVPPRPRNLWKTRTNPVPVDNTAVSASSQGVNDDHPQ